MPTYAGDDVSPGLRFENPFLLASAPPTESDTNILRAFEAGWGGRRHQDHRPAPGRQRQGPEDQVPPLDAEQLPALDGEAPRHGAALVLELGADFRQAARLVAAAAAPDQAGLSDRGARRVDHGRFGRRPRARSLARAGRGLSGAGRRRVGAEPVVPAHGSRGHGFQHRQELRAHRHGRPGRARSASRVPGLGQAHADHHEHRQGSRGGIRAPAPTRFPRRIRSRRCRSSIPSRSSSRCSVEGKVLVRRPGRTRRSCRCRSPRWRR